MSFEAPLPPYNASDPTASFLNSSCLDFLMIELVPMAHRVSSELDFGGAEGGADGPDGSDGSSAAVAQQAQGAGAAGAKDAVSVTTVTTGAGTRKLEDDEERDAVFYRLESLGYRVGLGLVERFSRDRPRFTDTLDVIKFLCKDLWTLVFKKQVDNLKTNHRGVYVLTDNSFRPLSRMSTDAGGQAVAKAQPFLWFPCGVVRGALAAMGINATVQAETNELPGAVFQIKTIPVKS